MTLNSIKTFLKTIGVVLPARTHSEASKRTCEWYQDHQHHLELHQYMGWSKKEWATYAETDKLPKRYSNEEE